MSNILDFIAVSRTLYSPCCEEASTVDLLNVFKYWTRQSNNKAMDVHNVQY